jgi:hypothetical protein
MTTPYNNTYTPLVVLGGDQKAFDQFADAYKVPTDINRIDTPMCLLRRMSTLVPIGAVFLPGFATESLAEAAERGVRCFVLAEHRLGADYLQHPSINWYFVAPDISGLQMPFCTLESFAQEVYQRLFVRCV